MPLVVALLGGLARISGFLVGRVLLALGLSYVTFKGFDIGVDWLLGQIKGGIGSMPSEIVDFLAFLWVDKAIGVMFSCWTACMAVKMLGGGAITKLMMK